MKYINYIFVMLIITLATSELKIMDFNINMPIGWLTLLILSFALFTILRNKLIIATLVLSMVVSRIISLAQPDFYLFYITINSLLFFIAGLIVFSVRERVFFKQLLFIICICAPIMFLQLAGVPWVQYHTYGQELALSGGFESTLFQNGPLNLVHAQFRPAGILWSNQPMGLLIAFSMAYFLFHVRQLKWIHYILFGFVVVLSTSYFVYFSYLIILSSIMLIRRKTFQIPKKKILTGTLVSVLLFSLIFPGVNKLLWDQYDIMNKVWVRLLDLQMAGIDIYSLPYVSDVESTLIDERLPQLNYLSTAIINSSEYKTFSMIGKFYTNPFILIIFSTFLLYAVIKVVKTIILANDPLIYSRIFTLMILFFYIVINPQFNWPLFAFLLAFPLTVIFPNFVNKHTLIKVF